MAKPKLIINKTYNIKVQDLTFGVLPQYRVVSFFKDGRTSEILQAYLTSYFMNLKETTSCSSFDILDVIDIKKYEVKTLAKNPSVALYPSNMRGSGRSYNKAEHIKRIQSIDGLIIIDNRNFPEFKLRLIPTNDLLLDKNNPLKTLSQTQVTKLMNLKTGESIKNIFNS